MRDVIYNELMKVYATDVDAAKSTYVADVNAILADQLVDYIQNGRTIRSFDCVKDEYYERNLPPTRREIIRKIWMVWPGGDTAEHVAGNIIDALGLELEDEE